MASRRKPRRLAWWLAVATAVSVVVALEVTSDYGNVGQTSTVAHSATSTEVPPIDASHTRTQLEELTVHDDAWRTDYEREAFGEGWADLDGDGCHTRDEVLVATLGDRTMLDSCRVSTGTLSYDPYTAATIQFQRGGQSEIDIDHVVALADAWNSGAWTWSDSERERFANDPTNLLAVDAATNRAKGASSAADWLPPNTAFTCRYIATQIEVKHTYNLTVTSQEAQTMFAVLDNCQGESP